MSRGDIAQNPGQHGEGETMTRLGIISGTIMLKTGIFKGLKEMFVENEFGKTHLFLSDEIAFIARHRGAPGEHILPHLINHPANFKALKDHDVDEVIGIHSTGSVKRRLKPGTFVVPHDFILLTGGPTLFRGKPVHITPTLSEAVRRKWIEASRDCSIEAVPEGVYWQTTGPRLETRAEIAMIAQFADVVGMTMASEAIIAKEMEMEFASLCSIDNYAHGIGEKVLTMEAILRHARKNADAVMEIVARYIERRRR
jgi:5'-methylthioadenosine phosphorylase